MTKEFFRLLELLSGFSHISHGQLYVWNMFVLDEVMLLQLSIVYTKTSILAQCFPILLKHCRFSNRHSQLAAMDQSELSDKVLELSKVSTSLSDSQLDDCARMGSCIERFLMEGAESFMKQYSDEPVMICYLADGWSCDLTARHRVWFAGASASKKDMWKGEFIMERAVLRAAPSAGEPGIRMVMAPPRLLSQGKTSWNAFTAACEFLPMGRCMGHENVCITVYCLDGHLFTSCMQKLKPRHQLYYEHLQAEGNPLADLLKAMDWVVGIKCVAHACSNAVKWGLGPFKIGDTNDDAHLLIAGLRNSSFDLQNQADQFLMRHVRFRDGDTPLHLAAQFWLTLAVKNDYMDLFIKVDPFWDGENLHVNGSMAGDPDCFALLSTIVGYSFKWVNWSDTRWVKMAKSARLFMRSLAIGIEGAVAMSMADSRASNDKLASWPRNTPIVRKYLAVAATSAGPLEAVLFQLLKDDRMLRFLPHLKNIVSQEVASIRVIDMFTWNRLAQLVGGGATGQEIRSISVDAALTGVGYLHREAFHMADIPPLCYTQGDIEANVAELAGLVGPAQDPLTQQMRDMLSLGCCQGQLVAALTLLRDASCSIGLVEQAHASGAVLHRDHKQYVERVLRCRIMVHQARALFTPVKTPKRILDQMRTLQRLDKARPENVCGRQYFLKELIDRLLGTRLLPDDEHLGSAREAFRRHAELYDDLDAAQQDEYDVEAQARAAERREEIDQERETIRKSIAQLELDNSAHRRQHGLPAHVDSVKLSQQDLGKLTELFNLPSTQALGIDSLPLDQAPRAPDASFQAEIERIQEVAPPCSAPWWLKMLCWNRDNFEGVCLYPEERRRFVYFLLFAKKSPYEATFLRLTRREVLQPLNPIDADWPTEFRSEFDIGDIEVVLDDQVPFTDMDDIWVVRGIRFNADGAFSNYPAERFERFTLFMPRPAAAPATGRARRQAPRDYRMQILEENPFLDPEDLGLGVGRATGRVARPRTGRGPHDEAGSDDDAAGVDDGEDSDWDELDIGAEVIDVGGEISEMRAGIAALDDEDSYFFVMVRGGAWTLEHKGVAADACAGKARAGLPRTWCNDFKYPMMLSASFKRYDRDGAMELAREYCRRGHFFFRLWLESDALAVEFAYTQAHIDSYVPHPDWIAYLEGVAAGSFGHKRAVKVNGLYPRLG